MILRMESRRIKISETGDAVMTLEEIAEQCEEKPEFLENDIYLVKPKKSHPVFIAYLIYVNQNVGLYQIRAISDEIKTNKYGTELQNSFNDVKDRISKTYGKPEIYDDIDRNLSTSYQKDEYWFYTLKEGSRELFAVWGNSSSLADNLDFLSNFFFTMLGVSATFKNFSFLSE